MWHFDKCRLRRACAASFQAYKLQMMFGSGLKVIEYLNDKQRLCSEPLLVTHTTLLETSCCGSGSYNLRRNKTTSSFDGFFLLISPGKPLLSYVSRLRQKSPLAKKELTRAEGHISSMNFNSVTVLSSSWVIFLCFCCRLLPFFNINFF